MFKNFLEKRKLFKSLESIDFNSCNIVVLTGAGISEESGVSTFRGNGGLWENERIEEVCRPEALKQNPLKVLSFYNHRRRQLMHSNFKPNKAHLALKALEEKLGNRLTIITQNIDNLHELAGSSHVIHVHGSINQNLCSQCSHVYESEEDISYPNVCPKCNTPNSVRPNVVFFKEQLQHVVAIEKALNKCQLIISIGSSGVVYPVAYYPSIVQDNGALSICLNKEVPANDAYFNHILTGNASTLVPEVVNWILRK